MKKLLFILLMLLTMGISGFAQYPVTVTIGTGTSSTYTVPFDNYYKNSWDQMIYPASQIGVGGYITSIAFEVDAVPSSNYPFSTLTIYMGTSPDSVHSSTSSWLPMSELTEVYSATNVASPTATGWQTFTLNTPFPYDGSDNLVIVTSKTMANYSSALKYRYTPGATNCCLYRRNDSDASYASHPGTAAASGQTNTRPNLQLSINVSSDFCYPVTNLAVSNLTSSDATITWNSSSSAGASYILQYKTAIQNWSSATTVDLFDTIYDMTGMLTASTDYNVRIASDCGNDTSAWKNLSFTTPCEAVTTLPFTENFDVYTGATSTTMATNNLPVCWSYLNAGTSTSYSGYPIIYNSSTYSASGSNSLRFYSYITAGTYDDQMAILPQIDPSIYPVSSLQLSFDARNNGTYTFEVVVGVIANPNDKTTFVPVDTIITTSNTYATYDFPFSHYTGPEGFIAFMAPRPSTSYNAGYIDNIVVDVIPTCPRPKNLTTVSATENSIELGWDEMGTATAWDIEYGPMGFTPGEGTVESVTTNPYTINALDASTLYDFYVKSNCGGGDISDYSTGYTTGTDCTPISTLPFEENFDLYHATTTGSVANLPYCWSKLNAGTSTSYTGYPIMYNSESTAYSVNNSVRFYTYTTTGTYDDQVLILPPLDQTIYPVNNVQLSFYARNASTYTFTAVVGVMSDPTDKTTFEPVDTIITTSSNYTHYEFPFNHYTGTGSYIAIMAPQPTTSYNAGHIDNIVLDVLPTCLTPRHLTASNATTTSIDLSWTEMGTATAWDIEYGPMGFTPGTGDIVTASTNPYTVTDLDHSTGYDFYVRANCGGGDVSNLSIKCSAATSCAPIDVPYFQNFDLYEGTTSTSASTAHLPVCWSKINAGTSTSYTGYPIIYNSEANAASGTNSMRFYIYTTTGTYDDQIAVLPEIDVNSNPMNSLQISFDARNNSTYTFTLYVGILTDPANKNTFVPLDTIVTTSNNYANYVVPFTNYTGTGSYIALYAPRPSSSYNSGYIDNIIVEPIPSCPRPQSFTATSTATDEVILSWVDNNASQWDVIYGPTGFDIETPGEGIIESGITTTTHTISGLTAGVIYDFYVRANCGGGDFSNWSLTPATASPYTIVMGITGSDTVTSCNFIVTDDGGISGSYSNNCNYTLVIYPGEPDSVVSISGTFVGETTVDYLSVYDGTAVDDNSLLQKITSGTSGTVINFGPLNSTTGPLTLLFHSDGSIVYPGFVAQVSCAEPPACPKPYDVHASIINSTDATITWEATGATNFNVAYSTSPNFDPNNCPDFFTTTTNSIELYNLTAYTMYYVMVQSDCGAFMSEWSNLMSFRTTCDPIDQLPYTMNFDNVPGATTTSVSTNNLPACWFNINDGTNSSYSGYPIVYESSTYAASGNNSMRFYSYYTAGTYDDQIAVLPNFDPTLYPINTLQVTFEARAISTSYTFTLMVGVLSSPSDRSTFVPIDTFVLTSTSYQLFELPLNQYTGDGQFIAFYAPRPETSYNQGYVDNIVVDVIPSCPRPINFAVAGVTSTSVDLSWTEVGDATAWEIEYGAPGFTPGGTAGEVVQVTDNPYTLENLNPATTYDIYIRSDCGGEYSQYVRDEITVTTACTPIDSMPYMENFDTYGTSTSSYPTCWSKINTYTSSDRPYCNSSGAYAGAASLYFYAGTTGTYNIAIMPMIDESIPVNTLAATFMYKATNASDRLVVGVMTNPTDASTFVAIDTIRPATSYTTWVEREVIFASYTGNGQYIAFKNAYTTTTAYAYIDNLVIDVIPTCPKPSQIHVVSTTTSSIELGWTENGTAGEWEIEYGPAGFTQGTGTIEDATDNPYTITGLNASTSYDFYIRAVCGTDDYSNPTPVYTAATQCAAIDFLPYTENFDVYGTGTTAYPLCWSKNNTYTSSPNMPYINSTHYAGVGSLYFYTATSGTFNIAITPEFDASIPVNTLQATFMYRASNSTDKLIVGVMTNPNDASTFVPVDTITPASTASTWVEKEVAFSQYTGSGQYIAFMNAYTTSSCYTYIDNLYINLIPTCPKPNHLAVTDVTVSTVTLDWQPVGGENSWEIAYGEIGFDPDGATATVVSANTHPFTVQGLTDATSYQFYVRAFCSASDQSYWVSQPANATTLCDGAVSLPYTQDFEGYVGTVYNDPNGIAPACWTTYSTNATYGAPHITGSGSYHYVNSGTNSMVFTCNSSGTTAYAALPTFDQPLNTLSLNFWRAMENISYGELTVGYVTSLTDFDNSYVVVATIPNVGSTSGDTISVNFTETGIPAAGNICFRWYKDGTFYSCCIDDISVTSDGSAPVVTDPTVATNAVTSITQTSATLNATITNPSGVTITAKGFEWRANSESSYTQIAGTGTGNTFTANLTTLIANTDYTYKAFITFNGTTVYGDEMTFTTSATPVDPCDIPTNLQVSNISQNSATMTWTAGGSETAWKVGYKLASASQWQEATVQQTSYLIEGLTSNTTYSVRVKAICATDNESDFATTTFTTLPAQYTVTLNTSNATMGSVSPAGASTVNEGSSFIATATANDGYHFVNWTNAAGTVVSTNNPYNFTVTANTTLTAHFEANDPAITYYNVNVISANTNMGNVNSTASGSVAENTSVTVTATANPGYHFVNWTNAAGTVVTTDNPYTFTVTSDITLTANFEANPVTQYTVTLNTADATMGTVSPEGATTVNEGESFTATATPLEGYRFVNWTNETGTEVSTANPYTFTVTADVTLIAKFEVEIGINEVTLAQNISLMPNPADNYIELRVNSNVVVKEAVVYNAFGQMIQTVNLTDNHARIDLSNVSSGMYFVRVNGEGVMATKKFIKR